MVENLSSSIKLKKIDERIRKEKSDLKSSLENVE